MTFQSTQISSSVWTILEEGIRGCLPISYLIIGDEKALLIDTGYGTGNIYHYIKMQNIISKKMLIVVNTHSHPEQTGGNFHFSTTGRDGLAHLVEDLCASGSDKYYTKLMNSNWHWEIQIYKVTRWLSDGEKLFLGDQDRTHNVVEVIWTPGHTPDSLTLWYEHDKRLFIGDLFYRFDDIMLSYDHANIKDYEASIRKILNFIMNQAQPKQIRYSASKKDTDFECLPIFKQYHRFLLSVLAGTHIGSPLRIDEADGWRFETRDKSMSIILSHDIVKRLNKAREKAQQYA